MITMPKVGVLLLDTSSNRIGRLVSAKGTSFRLRPPQGGREWRCRMDQTESVSLSSLVSVDDASSELTS